MSEPARSRFAAHFDRPLRRLVWVIPASLGLWGLVLIGFSFLIGDYSRQSAPLQVTLVESDQGEPGGDPGGGGGKRDGGSVASGAVRGSAATSHRSMFDRAPRPANRIATGHRPVVRRPHRPPVPKGTNVKDEEAFAGLTPEARAAAHAKDDEPVQPPHRAKESALRSDATAGQLKGVESKSDGLASLAGAGAPSGSGGDGKGGNSYGNAGLGKGGRGGGSGDGIGAGAQAYAAVEHPPMPIAKVLPTYPHDARAQGVEGEVVLRAIVDPTGAVEPEVVVVESIPMLDQAAIDALRRWRFAPGRDRTNRPVPVVIEVPLRFRLR